ncbi:MAG: hypothetical protein WA210_19380 [Burkholderiaceae bacterium]
MKIDKKTLTSLRGLATLLIALSAGAQAAPNDEKNYRGDRISFPVDITATLDSDAGGKTVCIPANTTLQGLGSGKNTGDISVRIGKVFGDVTDCKDTSKTVPKTVGINIAKQTLDSYIPDRFGLTYGALVVPFKYHYSGSKEFKGGSTVGPYLGYRFDRNTIGLGLKFVGFLGGSAIAVDQVVNGTTTTQNLAGFSYGYGFIGQVKNEFQLGVVVGKDRVSQSAGYADNGKSWVAISLGFAFSE